MEYVARFGLTPNARRHYIGAHSENAPEGQTIDQSQLSDTEKTVALERFGYLPQ